MLKKPFSASNQTSPLLCSWGWGPVSSGALAVLIGLLLLLGSRTPFHAQQTPKTASILIEGGTVIDGTGAKRRQADVRIEGDHIAAIGHLKPKEGERVIEAKGMVVAPGFIDTHSHADGGLLEMPDAESMIRQGITTSVVGQDGGSHYPLKDYFESLESKHVALNIASFVGFGMVRGQVMGKDFKRPATPEEIAKMRDIVGQEMQAGALGLSSGLEYDPGFYSKTEEVIECAKVAGQQGGIYISHVRNEDNFAFKSFQELIRIAQEGHLPAQISHIKLGAKGVWGKAGDVLTMMQDADKRGLDISADVYPYVYWQSTITALIPSRDWDNRALWEKGLDDVGGAKDVLLTSYGPDPTWAGKTIAAISDMTQKDPVSVIQEIVRKTHQEGSGGESVVVTAMSEDDLRRFIAAPRIMFCTDGGLRGTHPRGAGSFPRILGRYVREYHVLTLEQAIHKMTGLPAARMGFTDRGGLQVGKKADIVIFDPDKIIDTATTADPTAKPLGLPYVFVNGGLVLDDDKITGEHPGMVLKRPSMTGKRIR